MNATRFLPLVVAAVTIVSVALSGLPAASARTWTAADGRTLEAEFISATETHVTLRRSKDGRRFTMALDKISEADRDWVAAALAESSGPEKKEATGIFEGRLNSEWEKMEFGSLVFRFYGGKRLSAKKRYPIVIFLHGKGSGGSDNEKQLNGAAKRFANGDFYKENPSFILVPQCPDDSIGWRGEHLDDVIGLIESALEKLPSDEDRVYITGVSMGGFGTWSALAANPKLFAAAVPVCGGGNPSTARSIKKIAIWAHHGALDDVVPVESTRRMVTALEKSNGNIKYSEYPDIKHNAWEPAYGGDEVYQWLFKQRRGQKIESDAAGDEKKPL